MKDSDIHKLLDDVLGDIIGDVLKASLQADAIRKLAANYGLGETGTRLLALAYKLRHYAEDSVNEGGEVEPTLWIIDDTDRQWAMHADIVNSEERDEQRAIALLLKRLGAVAYLMVRESTSVRVSMNMTQLEKKAARNNPDNTQHVVVLFGEAIDGSGLLISYLREDGKIDIDQPFSSIVGPKSKWPGPHGSSFTDHGMKELLPRPKDEAGSM